MSLLTKVKSRLKSYTRPLPMEEFEDYDVYWESRGNEPKIRPRWVIAVDKIPDGSSVLDVGCSTGGFMAYLLSRRPNVKVRGTDVSQGALDIASEAGFDVFPADLTQEPLDREYDYITCFEVIEHIHEAEKVLVHLRDATRKQLIMSLPNLGYIGHRVRLGIFGRFPNTSLVLHAKEHIRHWSVRDFRDWADHFGLDVVSVEGQKGFPIVPWKKFPSLFAAQVVYTLEPRR
jgi:methionine biosynthesis protein MetW